MSKLQLIDLHNLMVFVRMLWASANFSRGENKVSTGSIKTTWR